MRSTVALSVIPVSVEEQADRGYASAVDTPKPRRLLNERRLEVRTRVLEAAYRLFAQGGFTATTMDDIASASGVPRRTLFRHFGTKEQVALAYQDTILDELVARLERWPAGGTALSALIETISAFVRDLRHEQAIELSDLLVRNPELRIYNLQKYEEIEAALAQAVEGRCASASPALEARIMAASVVATWRVANERWLAGDRSAHPKIGVMQAFDALKTLGQHRSE